VADVDISAVIAQHARTGKTATLTAVQPPGRYGALELDEMSVTAFREKPEGDGGWINGGFFVVNPEAISLIEGDHTSWEGHVLPILACRRSLGAYFHKGFWQPMDTLREKNHMEELWASGRAPWKIW
jgi:glucose-1-phosphate cytidylyltransferase